MYEITDKNILGIIIGLQKNGEAMDSLRQHFPKGEAPGQRFVEKLYELHGKGYIRNVEFVYDSEGEVIEAVWSSIKITNEGLKYHNRLKGQI